MRDSGERRALGEWVLAAPLGGTRDVELDFPDSRLAAEHALDVGRELPEHLGPVGARAEVHPHRAVLEREVGHHPELHDVAIEAGKAHRAQRVPQPLGSERHDRDIAAGLGKGNVARPRGSPRAAPVAWRP